MKLLDANVLLYAVNSDARHHERSRRFLDSALSGSDTIAFSWIALLAFVRLSTHRGVFSRPLAVEAAFDQVEEWLGAPPSVTVEPTSDHARLVRSLLAPVGSGGNLVNDAHLAALAVQHRCVIVSFDRDFGRFDGVEWSEPPDPGQSADS